MKTPIPGVDPVAIALDQIEAGEAVRLSGIDLETGCRVSVWIERTAADSNLTGPHQPAAVGLVLVLSIQTIEDRH